MLKKKKRQCFIPAWASNPGDDVGNGLEQLITATEAIVFNSPISSLSFPCFRNLIIQGQTHKLQTYLSSKSLSSLLHTGLAQQLKFQFLQKGLSTDYIAGMGTGNNSI